MMVCFIPLESAFCSTVCNYVGEVGPDLSGVELPALKPNAIPDPVNIWEKQCDCHCCLGQ